MYEYVLEDISKARETYWENAGVIPFEKAKNSQPFGAEEIEDAGARLDRFAPLIMKLFPETIDQNGIIESPLKEIEKTKEILRQKMGEVPTGKLFIKCDSHLAIAGSVKARGGIYEVLKHTEELALAAGILKPGDDYSKLTDYRDYFAQYSVQVGSTGNLGMSIGIMSAAIGYKAIVHMSSDAKEWKKKLLRSKGVIVKEYASDYSKAVSEGRKISDLDPNSYFVDDEHSVDLFLGYAVAGKRLAGQLEDNNIKVDAEHPLYVYIPCGVGGAPGGITFGLKNIWGDNVHCFFVEPTQAPCMLAGLASGRGDEVCVQDYGLTGVTAADGLAVGRCSRLVARIMAPMLSGISTVADDKLFEYMRLLHDADDIIIEPSSCAAFEGYINMAAGKRGHDYFQKTASSDNATHIIWATGGSLMPDEIIREYLNMI